MNNGVKIGHLFPVKHAPLRVEQPSRSSLEKPQSTEFQQLLDAKRLKFSQHAEQRMEQRGIRLQPESIKQIVKAVDDAALKGARDSLVVFRDIAMIVNVPSRTVVTAMDGKQMNNNVFTQIDSAIILS